MKIIDISIPVNRDTPLWPDTAEPKLIIDKSIKQKDHVNDTTITINLHTGTHIDAPRHFFANGKPINQIPIESFTGSVFVAYLPKVNEITDQNLDDLYLPKGITKLLFKTSNSLLYSKNKSRFHKNYVGLTSSAAKWLVEHKIKLVGVDYISVAKFDETIPVHKILLKNNIIILEGINLKGVKEGIYKLECLPIKILNTESSPTRAILIKP